MSIEIDKAMKITNEIREIATHSVGGLRDDATLKRLSVLLSSLRHIVGTGPAYDEIPILESWCDKYFSPRKHLKHPGGLQMIQVQILTCLNDIEYDLSERA